MSRKLPGSAIVPGSITLTQITGSLNDTTNAAYVQANTARGTANDAYGQANTARANANTTFGTINTTFGTVNTTFATINSSFGTVNTNITNTNSNAINAYAQANSAYGQANTRLANTGGTISGDLIITGNLTVSGNQTILNTEVLTTEDADIVLLSNTSSTPALNAGLIINRGTSTNTFFRWNEVSDKWGYSDDGTTFYSLDDIRSGLVTHNTTFGTVNTSLGTINTTFGTVNTNITNLNSGLGTINTTFGTVNTTLSTINSTFSTLNTADSNRVLKAGDTMTGQLNISSGGLLVTGNSNFDSGTLFVDSVNDRIGIGTASPGAKLEILGDNNQLYLKTTGSYASLYAFHSATNTGALYWDSNSNCFLEARGASGSIYFGAGGTTTTKMTVLSSGNVGIGTTSPSTKLHVYESGAADAIFRITPANGSPEYDGLIQIVGQGNNITTEGFEVWYDNDVGDVHLSTTFGNDAASIHFHTRTGASKSTSNERLTILGGGNVGIGTTSPGYKLDVNGKIFTTEFQSSSALVGNINYLGTTYAGFGSNASNKGMWFARDFANSYPDIVVSGTGNVGIGTTSPARGLHVATGDYIRMDGSGESSLELKLGGNIVYLAHAGWGIGANKFGIGGGSSPTILVDVSSGNVGIGTTSPVGRLSVIGSDNTTQAVFSGAIGTTGRGLRIATSLIGSNNEGAILDAQATTGSATLIFQTASTERARIDSSGNVGIGTTSPGQKLTLHGNSVKLRLQTASDPSNYYLDLEANYNYGEFFNFVANGGGGVKTIIKWADAAGLGLNGGAGPVKLENNGTEIMRVHTNGNVGIGTTSPAAKLDVNGSIFPTTDNSYNLGSTSKRWANIYTGDLHLSNEGKQNSVDSTWGDWTIQEGEDNLYVINNRNGKKFKIKLEEV